MPKNLGTAQVVSFSAEFGVTASRRFPPPWSVEDYNSAYFIVRDTDGQQLAYVQTAKLPSLQIIKHRMVKKI